jgi:hypothetical protein
MKKVLLAAVAVAALAGSAHADLLAYWNFNVSTPGSGGGLGTLDTWNGTGFPADVGTGLLTSNITRNTNAVTPDGTLGTFGGDLLNSLFGDPTGGALAIQGGASTINNGNWFQFEVPTTGYEDIILTYATRGTGTGFNSHAVSYSVDGGAFVSLGAHAAQNSATWVLHTTDLSAISAADNVASLVIRITLSGATGATGNNRFDNVQVNGTQIPTPGSLALLGLGGLVAARRRRA